MRPRATRTLVAAAYPFLVYVGLTLGGARPLAAGLALVLLVQGGLAWRHVGLRRATRLVLPALPLLAILIVAGVLDEGRVFLFVPALISAALLLTFGRTLVSGPPMAEVFARMRGRELPEDEIAYCRGVTAAWCVFFVLNGGVSLWLALDASLEWWTFYNGFVAYLLIGTLFGVEMTYRYWRFRPYDGRASDLLYRRIFPPR